MQWNSTVTEGVLESSVKQFTSHVSPGVIHETLARGHGISTELPKDSGDNVECLGIDNTRRKIIRRKEPNDNNLIRRKKAKKGFQVADDNTFTDRAPPSFGVLEEYGSSYSCYWDVLTVYLSKDSKFVGSVNKLIQVKPLSAGYLHSIADSNSGSRLNFLNWMVNYKHEEASPSLHCVPSQEYEIPRKPPWFVAMLLLCESLRRRKLKGDTTAHSTPCPATTITTEVFSQKEEDTRKLLTANAHSGNVYFQMEIFKGGSDGM
ncbi:hypothetical protein MKW98_009033 [Papaver atlanticum]|uniref:Uncharacterized protein n=1 Tax=Papaver atlanticum TaxID=357466 RepID=A0AAD4RX50_9MAGN|nr:hypothetical protein MKW98_009033 [Papaver atlanticum]